MESTGSFVQQNKARKSEPEAGNHQSTTPGPGANFFLIFIREALIRTLGEKTTRCHHSRIANRVKMKWIFDRRRRGNGKRNIVNPRLHIQKLSRHLRTPPILNFSRLESFVNDLFNLLKQWRDNLSREALRSSCPPQRRSSRCRCISQSRLS